MKTRLFLLSSILFIVGLLKVQSQVINENLKVNALTNQLNSDREKYAHFGGSVAISGNYAVVGAHGKDNLNTLGNGKGAAYIFKRPAFNAPWEFQQKIVASDGAQMDSFGSVAISGKYLVVGASGEDHDVLGGNYKEDAGAAYIFEFKAGFWSQIKKIVAPDRASKDYFGASVSISGSYLVVGAMWNGPRGSSFGFGAGAAYVFEYNSASNSWEYVQKLTAHDREPGDLFGVVSISGNSIIVGAHREDDGVNGPVVGDSGSAYIFERDASLSSGTSNAWMTPPKKITAMDRGNSDYFGYAVAISGDYALVGAHAEDEDDATAPGNTLESAGSAYIFQRNTMGDWVQVKKLVALDRAEKDGFGIGVTISGDYAMVGAYREDSNGHTNSGAAYLFKKTTTPPWGQVKKLIASDAADADSFGRHLAISGCDILVGAVLEDEDTLGANTLDLAGSAYFFECEETVCDIPNVAVSLGRIKLSDNFRLKINSGTTLISKVEVSFGNHNTTYNNDLCATPPSGTIGNLKSRRTNWGGLVLNNNNTQNLSWNTGTPTILTGHAKIKVSKPGILELPCCTGKFHFCLNVKLTDSIGNVCEKQVCGVLNLESLRPYPNDFQFKESRNIYDY
ncbi:MAG: FG-GAP repeat protein [Bacteroidota bacterium]